MSFNPDKCEVIRITNKQTTNTRLLYPSEETRITCNCTIGKIPWVTLSEQPFLEQTYTHNNEKGQLQHCLSK